MIDKTEPSRLTELKNLEKTDLEAPPDPHGVAAGLSGLEWML